MDTIPEMTDTVFSASESAADPIWIDDVWLDTVVVVGLTCFILCLMGLSKVRKTVNSVAQQAG